GSHHQVAIGVWKSVHHYDREFTGPQHEPFLLLLHRLRRHSVADEASLQPVLAQLANIIHAPRRIEIAVIHPCIVARPSPGCNRTGILSRASVRDVPTLSFESTNGHA